MQLRLLESGSRLVTSDVQRLKLYDVTHQPTLLAEVEQPGRLPYFDQNPSGERLAVTRHLIARSFTPLGKKPHWVEAPTTVGIYDAKTLATQALHELGMRLDHETLALSPDGTTLASVSRGSGAVAFDALTGQKLWQFDGEIASGVSWSPDGRYLAIGETGQAGGELFLIDTLAPGGPAQLPLPDPANGAGLNDSPFQSEFSPDGRLCAIANASWGSAGVVVYEVSARREVWSANFPMVGEEDAESWPAPEVTFALGGALVLVGQQGRIQAFQSADGRELPPLSVDAADGPYFAADDRGRIWVSSRGEPTALPFPEAWRAT